MQDNPYSTFWSTVRSDQTPSPLFCQGIVTSATSVQMGTIPLTSENLLLNANLSGTLKNGEKVLLAPLDSEGQLFVVLCKVVKV